MADINKIAEELGTLTILEAADLVKLLEEKCYHLIISGCCISHLSRMLTFE